MRIDYITKNISLYLDQEIFNLANIFINQNHDFLLVGGCIRDLFLNKIPKDFDLVTNALPAQIINILIENNIKYTLRGVEFGVIVININNVEYELATYRSDVSAGSGNLMDDNVKFGVSIEDDSSRRDLTINALYFDLNKCEIIDLVGGIKDLENGIIRTVGNPEERFAEDSTRKLRVVRFLARYNFRLDYETEFAIKNNPELNCNNERIEAELVKIFATDNTIAAMHLNNLNLIPEIFKGINTKTVDSFVESLEEFIALVIPNTDEDYEKAKSIIKNSDIINGARLLANIRDKKITLLDANRKIKSTNIDSSFDYFDPMIPLLTSGKVNNVVKQLNRDALSKGLSGKEIGEYVEQNIYQKLQLF